MGIKGRKKGIYEPLASIIDRYSMPIPECGCYVWLGGTSGKDEYGRVSFFEADGTRRTKNSHRMVYKLFKGQIPDDLEIDHLCNMPWCVNPDHLRAVPREENTRKAIKEFCDKGHLRIEVPNREKKKRRRFECPICRAKYQARWVKENKDWINAREAKRRDENRAAYNARKLAEAKRRASVK